MHGSPAPENSDLLSNRLGVVEIVDRNICSFTRNSEGKLPSDTATSICYKSRLTFKFSFSALLIPIAKPAIKST